MRSREYGVTKSLTLLEEVGRGLLPPFFIQR